MKPIAHIETLYKSKFGVPRQAGLVSAPARVVFEPEYRVAEAVRGLEEFDYVWLLWQFHLTERQEWSPTVRPPRLGGNKRVGVFATRSPFRPNPIGLSSVRLLKIAFEDDGPVLYVEGADLVDGTPVYDIKPYLPYTDCHPDARSGFAPARPEASLRVDDPDGLIERLPEALRRPLVETLMNDPRPHYQHDPERVYGMPFDRWEVRFRVDGDVLQVVDIALNNVN